MLTVASFCYIVFSLKDVIIEMKFQCVSELQYFVVQCELARYEYKCSEIPIFRFLLIIINWVSEIHLYPFQFCQFSIYVFNLYIFAWKFYEFCAYVWEQNTWLVCYFVRFRIKIDFHPFSIWPHWPRMCILFAFKKNLITLYC